MGFFELLLIAVITLLVVGPERMPEAVRTIALTVGRIKRSFNKARSEIEKQVGADDIRRQLHNEAILEDLGNIKSGLADIRQQADQASIDTPSIEDSSQHPKKKPDSLKSTAANSSPASTASSYTHS